MPNQRQIALEVLKILAAIHPAHPALDYTNPLELLVATILSAQCTDIRVNQVTRDLFRKYRHPEDYAAAKLSELEKAIRSTGFYHNKAKAIIGMAGRLVDNFHSRVPDTMEELLTLPGVARKTANVVLGAAFGKAEGIVVDTHVKRVAPRLGWTRETDPNRIERDLMELLPREHWIKCGALITRHGRDVCRARQPICSNCPVSRLCPSAGKVEGSR